MRQLPLRFRIEGDLLLEHFPTDLVAERILLAIRTCLVDR